MGSYFVSYVEVKDKKGKWHQVRVPSLSKPERASIHIEIRNPRWKNVTDKDILSNPGKYLGKHWWQRYVWSFNFKHPWKKEFDFSENSIATQGYIRDLIRHGFGKSGVPEDISPELKHTLNIFNKKYGDTNFYTIYDKDIEEEYEKEKETKTKLIKDNIEELISLRINKTINGKLDAIIDKFNTILEPGHGFFKNVAAIPVEEEDEGHWTEDEVKELISEDFEDMEFNLCSLERISGFMTYIKDMYGIYGEDNVRLIAYYDY